MPSADHPITTELAPADIERRLALLRQGIDPDREELFEDPVVAQEMRPEEPEPDSNGYRYYRPWVEAADEYIHWSKHPEVRVYTGIPEFDQQMRGLAPAELMLVVGYAHSGKTLFTTQMLLHNHDRRVAIFTPDETRVAVLVKMTSILHGISAEELEERLQADDEDAENLLRSVARDYFPNFAVFDELTDLGAIDRAVDECERHWKDRAQLIVIDYADLITGVGEDVPSKMNAIKAWGKDREVPLVVLHQASRSSGAAGRKMEIDSGGYGGEQQATFLIGVRRKKNQYAAILNEIEERVRTASQPKTIQALEDQAEEARYELERHRDTVTFSLLKNKRPPSRLVDDTDFVIDPDTGRIAPFDNAAPRYADYQSTVEFYGHEQGFGFDGEF